MSIISSAPKNNIIKNTIDAKLNNFLNILHIEDVPNVKITSLQTSNVIYVSTNTECVQFDVNFDIPLDFNVDMKIIYPRLAHSEEYLDIGKLRINVNNDIVKDEIISCTNYLQRQKNVNLALSVLKKCAAAISERNLIRDMLILHSEEFITYSNHEDGGIHIKCTNPNTNFKYFESLWKIQFDCINNMVMDYIDFSITMLDREFNAVAKPIANTLIEPSLPYNIKVEMWWKLIYAVSESVTKDVLNSLESTRCLPEQSFLTVRSLQNNNFLKYEIVESDEEDCIIIDD